MRCGYHGWHDWCAEVKGGIPKSVYSDVLDFSSFSGLPNTTTFGSGGANGDVYFGTKDEGSADTYTVVLECIKVYAKDNT